MFPISIGIDELISQVMLIVYFVTDNHNALTVVSLWAPVVSVSTCLTKQVNFLFLDLSSWIFISIIFSDLSAGHSYILHSLVSRLGFSSGGPRSTGRSMALH